LFYTKEDSNGKTKEQRNKINVEHYKPKKKTTDVNVLTNNYIKLMKSARHQWLTPVTLATQ
jgi:hypothetical protein